MNYNNNIIKFFLLSYFIGCQFSFLTIKEVSAQTLEQLFIQKYGRPGSDAPAARSQPSPKPLTEAEKAAREEQQRILAEQEQKNKVEAREKAKKAAEAKAEAAAAAALAAKDRAERAQAARQEQKRIAAEQDQKKKLEAQDKGRQAAEADAQRKAREAAQAKAEADVAVARAAEKARIAAEAEAQEKARKAAEAKAESEAAAARAAKDRADRQGVLNALSPTNVEDPLIRFDGGWVPTAPPGPQIFFNKLGLGGRVVNLPLLGQAVVRVSNGESGSNFKISGQGFSCFYMVVFLRGNQRMVWDLKSGDPVCMPSNTYEQAE